MIKVSGLNVNLTPLFEKVRIYFKFSIYTFTTEYFNKFEKVLLCIGMLQLHLSLKKIL